MPVRIKGAVIAAASLICLLSSPIFAEEQEPLKPLVRPEATSVTTPKPAAASDNQYYYFYKLNVSYERAFSDLDECRLYALSARVIAIPPKFVPFGSEVVSNKGATAEAWRLQYGVVGNLLVGVLIQNAQDRNADATYRRCMAFKGYSRYATDRKTWEQIAVGTGSDRLARLALLASGQLPSTGAVGP